MPSISAIVSVIEDIAPDVRLFQLSVEGEPSIAYEAGGHIDVDVHVAGSWQSRSYSLVGFRRDNGLVIAVRRVDRGRGGSIYLWSLCVGARLRIRKAPNTLAPTYGANRYVLIAGGIGITPLTALARAFHEAGRALTLHYCVKSIASAAFVSDLQKLLGPALILHESARGHRLNVDALISDAEPQSIYYVCGPLGLMDAIGTAWRQRGLPTANLRFETFGNSGRLAAESFKVRVVETGVCLHVGQTQSLLDALIAAGQDVMFGCRRGECGLCKIRIESFDGQIDHRDVFLSEQERAANTAICCCVSRLAGSSITVGVDQISHGRSAPHIAAGRSSARTDFA